MHLCMTLQTTFGLCIVDVGVAIDIIAAEL